MINKMVSPHINVLDRPQGENQSGTGQKIHLASRYAFSEIAVQSRTLA